MRTKRIISASVACLMLVAALSLPASAISTSVDTVSSTFTFEVRDGEPTVVFVDPSLTEQFTSRGIPEEVYEYSYYVYSHEAMSAVDVGPRERDQHIISIARGEEKEETIDITMTGSISYNASVSAEIQSLISVGLGGSAAGSITLNKKETRVFEGPSETSAYNCRHFYVAINYDNYSCYLKRYDVYNLYNGSAHIKDIHYYKGLEAVNDVKKPKIISYSVNSMQVIGA